VEIWELIITILLTVLGSGSLIGLLIQDRFQKLRSIEEKLREERRKVYSDLLMPFIQIFTSPNEPEKVLEQIKSLNYRKTSFDLILLGSDQVVRAYGDLMQYIYQQNLDKKENRQNPHEVIRLWAILLFEIRKNLGNEKTILNEKDMLRHLITDINKMNFEK
jgi:hypothetical protein